MIIFNLFLFPYVHYGNIRNHKQAKMTAVNTLLYLLVSTFVPLSSHLCVCVHLYAHMMGSHWACESFQHLYMFSLHLYYLTSF